MVQLCFRAYVWDVMPECRALADWQVMQTACRVPAHCCVRGLTCIELFESAALHAVQCARAELQVQFNSLRHLSPWRLSALTDPLLCRSWARRDLPSGPQAACSSCPSQQRAVRRMRSSIRRTPRP